MEVSFASEHIFDYATKELSQDAVICWLLNWINYPKAELYELSREMFALLGEKDIKSQRVTIKTQIKNADIVVVLPDDNRILIIEDKVYSTEHDDQISKYVEAMKDKHVQATDLGVKGSLITDIRTIYFKTGFFYDCDKKVKADVIVTGKEFYDVLCKYEGKSDSEILNSYINHLRNLLKWYEEYGDYTKKDDDKREYISLEQIAQYNFMRAVFPEKMWDIKANTGVYEVYHGSSAGRPWTEMCICPGRKYLDGDQYYLFWKIDSDKKGPYLSLRLYDSKENKGDLTNHKKKYPVFVEYLRRVVESRKNETGIEWSEVEVKDKSSYRESSLMTIKLREPLENWGERGDRLIRAIREFTESFLLELDKDQED